MPAIDRASASALNFRPLFLLLSALTLVALLPVTKITKQTSLPFQALFVHVAAPAHVTKLKPIAPVAPKPSAFDREAQMSRAQLLDRWNPIIAEASRRFGVPKSWIRAVINRESGGRTMMAQNTPIVSDAGAIGVMQVMPDTYEEMRSALKLGADPSDPHDNIMVGTAYLAWLHRRYGFPDMFAAYNFGPGNFDKYRAGTLSLPAETVAYLATMKEKLDARRRSRARSRAA